MENTEALIVPELQTQTLLQAPEEPLSRAQKILRGLGWTGLTLGLLILFTLVKLPEVRLKNYIQGTLSNVLSQQGMSFSAGSASLSILFGVSYTLKNVVITPPSPDLPIKIDELEVSPAFLPLLTGKMGGNLTLKQGDGKLKASFALGKEEGSLSFSAKQLNLGRLGLMAMFAKLKGSATVNGEGSLSGNLNNPTTWNGPVKLDLSKITIDSQSISGFAVPALSISEGTLDATVGQGKALIKTLKLGKVGSADDLIANVTGDILLTRQMDQSTLNLKTRFKLSDKIVQAFPLIDALIGAGKQGDGYFAYNLSGPIFSPTPTPATAAGGQ